MRRGIVGIAAAGLVLACHPAGAAPSKAALDEALAAVVGSPGNPEAYRELGALQAKRGDHAAARATYERLLARWPTDRAGREGLAHALMALHDYDAALRVLDGLTADFPKDGRPFYDRAVVWDAKEVSPKAISDYSAALERAPDLAEAYYRRGWDLANGAAYLAALQDFRAAVKRDARWADAMAGEGWVLHKLGRDDEALAAYGRALAADPKSLEALNGRAFAYRELSRWDEAIADYRQVTRLEPTAAALSVLGFTIESKGDYPNAKRAYDQALKLDPKWLDALIARGRVEGYLKKSDAALADFAAALKGDPKSVNAYYNRADTYFDLGKLAEAEADLDAAAALDPKDTDVLYLRSRVFLEAGREDRAIRDLNAVLKLDPRHALAHIQKGFIYRELGDHLSAIECLDQGLALDPTYARAWLWRGLSKLELGDKAGGEADQAKARTLDPKVDAD